MHHNLPPLEQLKPPSNNIEIATNPDNRVAINQRRNLAKYQIRISLSVLHSKPNSEPFRLQEGKLMQIFRRAFLAREGNFFRKPILQFFLRAKYFSGGQIILGGQIGANAKSDQSRGCYRPARGWPGHITNTQIHKYGKYGIKVTDLLPVFLQAGLAGEVAGVMHGLQLPEDPATGKNVHPAQAQYFHFLFLCSSQTSCQLHSPSCSCSLLSAHHCH